MKRILVLVCTLAMVVFVGQASAKNMYGGIKGGVNFANLSGDDAPDDTSMRTGFQGGLFIGTKVNEEFGFRLEGLYVQKGASYDEDFGPGIGVLEVTTKLDYIEFPLLFVYEFPAGETVAFSLFAGPTFGFNIKGEAEVEDETSDIDDVKSFEFGAAIGAGLAKTMASGKAIGLDVRYSLGATSVIDVEDVSVKNTGIGVMAFFQVPLGAQE